MPKPSAVTQDTPVTRAGVDKKDAPQPKPMPLQVRWPREDVKAIKVAAAQAEQTVSDFMLACFHAFVERKK
jgi:hypothetical protein